MPIRYSPMPGNRGFCATGNWKAWREQFPQLPENPEDMYYDRDALNTLATLAGAQVIITTKSEKERRETLAQVARPTRDGRYGWDTIGWFIRDAIYAGPGICGERAQRPDLYKACGQHVEHRTHEYEETSAIEGYYAGAVCPQCVLDHLGIRTTPRN